MTEDKSKTLNVFLVLKHGWHMMKEFTKVGRTTFALIISIFSFLGGAALSWYHTTTDGKIHAVTAPIIKEMDSRTTRRDMEVGEIKWKIDSIAREQNRQGDLLEKILLAR